ncbi:MAG: hypothetical protein GXP30_13040, partial [Verrucomicrobia bacterium]|nr:hypothetical protein [Verrucomicrobiota bacterium]
DLQIGPEGALYVADFYNRIIGHYEVPLDHPGRDRERGRIWRIVKTDGEMKPPLTPKPLKADNPITNLKSASPFERRAAAEALQFDPKLESLSPLLKSLSEISKEDTHLRHGLRMAIQRHLELPGAFNSLPSKPNQETLSIALAVGNSAAANYILRNKPPYELRTAELKHIARYGDPITLKRLLSYIIVRTDWDVPEKRSLKDVANLNAIQQGIEERGESKPNAVLLGWAQFLARELLDLRQRQKTADWTELPHPENPKSTSPWVLQQRKRADGVETDVLSSLHLGEKRAEQRTGILRSKEFPAPASLSFWINGHRGKPDQKAHDHNFVRLVNAKSGDQLAKTFPPRSDVSEKIVWDLRKHKGKPVQLEIIDGDSGKAFAWIGITHIEPRVINIMSFINSNSVTKALGQLASMLKITAPVDLRDRLKKFLPPSPAPPPLPVSKEQRKQLDELIGSRVKSFTAVKPDITKGETIFTTN